MEVKVEVDKDTCMGCGACVTACGDAFEMGGDGKASAKKPVYEEEGCIMQGAEACPVKAIHVTIDGEKKI